MSENRLLITGATGYLGQKLLPTAADQAEVFAAARNIESVDPTYQSKSLDLSKKNSIFECVRDVQPTGIIHAAAINPGIADDQMQSVNHQGTGWLAEAANDVGCRLVMVSTDMVHDGSEAPYDDDVAANPINDYGLSKAQGEQAAFRANANTIAVRTSLIYGLDTMDRGTVGFAKRLAQGDPLTLFNDVYRQPVFRDALAQSLVTLALELTQETGLVNIAGSDLLDRATFGELMLEFWNVQLDSDSIEYVQASNQPALSGVPLNTELGLSKAKRLGLPTPGVYEVLAEV